MAVRFPHLMSPLQIGSSTVRNRIVSTGHDTGMPENGLPGDQLIAYQRARARGGAGLIVIQVASVHPSAFYTAHILQGHHDGCIPGYRRLAEAIHEEGAVTYGQLFHPGREIVDTVDGTLAVAWSSSATANERFHVKPRAMPKSMIDEIVHGYADTAARLIEAGLDGVEVVASHGYLPAQFLAQSINCREDAYGGTADNRMRFLREVLQSVRARIGSRPVIGMRISADDLDRIGLTKDEALAACQAMDRAGLVDYVSVVVGSSASRQGAYHLVAPMTEPHGYTAPFGAAVKAVVSAPVIVTGRINQPQIAEKMIASGEADACGMTRALICDPDMPEKAAAGRADDIRACIACNQACIGHFFMGVAISCIQHPETGRERQFEPRRPAKVRRRVLIAGGGPGGMKAAAVAAERGHDVVLCEASARLGGQALLAQLLPGRAEFGGIVTNLEREMELAGVEVRLNTRVDRILVEKEQPDAVIIATGAIPTRPEFDGMDLGHVVNAWQVLKREVNVGGRVVIADWRCDWIGYGLAEKLALDGCHVRLAVNGTQPGESIMQYVRDHAAGRLFKLGVEVLPYARLHGVDSDTVYLEHTMARQTIICQNVDTLVLALGHDAVDKLADELSSLGLECHLIGDALTPRTAEEAVFEGLKIASVL